MQSSPIAHLRIVSLPVVIAGIGYLAGYVLLDWISFVEPYGPVGITTWNPPTGLSLAFGLLFGRRVIPLLFIGPLLSVLILNQAPVPWSIELSFVTLIGSCYSAALLLLLYPSLRFDPALSSMRDLILLMLVAALSTAFVASGYAGVTVLAGLVSANEFAAAAFRYWVGDMIGIVVVTPFALIVWTRNHVLRISFETILQFGAIIAALTIMFGYAEEQRFQLFYVLFLPIVWIALRSGFEGAVLGILITQLGLIFGVMLFPVFGHDVLAFQVLMLILTTTGLILGELVTERRRTEFQLRLHRDSLARVAQLAGMGELTVAIAHELNQPLMAARTYTRLVEDAVSSGDEDRTMVADTAKKAVAQVERAAEVVRSLRALIRLDSSNRALYSVERIIKETLALCQPDLDRIDAGARAVIASDLQPVKVDILQIEQVLLNLLHNSIEAIGETQTVNRAILIEASAANAGFVEIRVSDNGPGFPPDFLPDSFFHFSPLRLKALASDCHYANQLSKLMVAVFGWIEMQRAAPFTSQSQSRRSRTMADPIRIALIDDDPAVVDSLRRYFQREKLQTSCFSASNEFLAAIDRSAEFDCVVSDVRMPGMSGLDLVGHLKARGFNRPIVLITGHGDIDMAVSAIKLGAFDFIEKPFDETRLLDSIRNAVEQYREHMSNAVELEQLRSRFNSLSPRQHQVMELVVAGLSSKEIGVRLNLSAKTVDNHRAWVMERIGARNLAELVRMATNIQGRAIDS